MTAPLPSATTRLFVLLGDPVAHSLSPVFQNAAIRALEIDAVYAALRCDATSLGPLMRTLARAGGGGNVTIPYKAAAAQCIEYPTAAVRRTGACNTFWGGEGGEGGVHGDNTDVEGVRVAVRSIGGRADGHALIIGAGGAAAAALCALLEDGAERVTLINRSPDRAHALARRFAEPERIFVATSFLDLAGSRPDLVVNATALGLRSDDPPPLDLDALGGAGAVLDVVYRHAGLTPLISQARRLGIPSADGTEMLLAQGAAAFRRWFDAEAPMDAMRAAIAEY